jgi:hypothetical protein
VHLERKRSGGEVLIYSSHAAAMQDADLMQMHGLVIAPRCTLMQPPNHTAKHLMFCYYQGHPTEVGPPKVLSGLKKWVDQTGWLLHHVLVLLPVCNSVWVGMAEGKKSMCVAITVP